MDTKLQDEILKHLDVVGDKLGVATQHIWLVLTRQGTAEGLADTILGSFLIIAGIITVIIFFKSFKRGQENNWYKDSYVIVCTVYAVLGVLLNIIGFCNVYSGILYLVNPEYYALEKLLTLLK